LYNSRIKKVSPLFLDTNFFKETEIIQEEVILQGSGTKFKRIQKCPFTGKLS
jgi:hypothetical protein